MATDQQIAANRLNARKSTGPRTEAGKNRTRLNAVKHGLTGHLVAMTEPEQQAHDTFVTGIIESLRPADPLEHQLAHSIAEGYWRLNRVSAIENSIFAVDAYNQALDNPTESGDTDVDDALAPALAFVTHPERFQLLTVYESRLHRKVRLDLRELREIQAARRAEETKKAEEAAAARSKAFDESCTLLELKMRQNAELQPEGSFTHPSGFVFSIPDLLSSMTVNRRYQRARDNLTTNPYTVDQLEKFSKPRPAPAQ